MGIHEDEAPRLSEIGRTLQAVDRKIDDFRSEIRQALNDKVSKEVYNAERQGLVDRDNAILERVATLEAKSRSNTNTIYGGLLSIVVGMVLFWLQARGM